MTSNLKGQLFFFVFFFVVITFQSSYSFANLQQDTAIVEDEFKAWDDEASSDDEFKEWNDDSADDEFKEYVPNDSISSCERTCSKSSSCSSSCSSTEAATNPTLIWIYWILGFTVLAGILSRIEIARKFRNLFLLASLVILGFYQGACPCPILHFENTVLFFVGVDIPWQNMIYFLALIPITYLFGKVWCGWICHLGALQEFLYLPAKFNILRSANSQLGLKILRYVLIGALILQLVIQQRVFWCKVDPFLSAFTLQLPYNNELVGGILLGLILLTSLFTFRPFCRGACPIGITLGWISAIPGASILGINGKCAGCKVCNNACKIDAIYRKDKYSILDNRECIACTDCIDSCTKGGLNFMRKNTKNKVNVHCSNECKI